MKHKRKSVQQQTAPPPKSEQVSPLQPGGVLVLSDIIAALQKTRDTHSTALDVEINRLRQIEDFARVAARTPRNDAFVRGGLCV